MPPRDPELPEGTDEIITGPSTEAGGRGRGGFVAKGGGGSEARGATDKLVSQVRDQVSSLRGQATDRLRGLADDGKDKAAGLLGDLSGVIDDAARSIDTRLGSEYGDYAHRAAGSIAGFAERVREKSVDDLIDDTRDVVRKSPAVAIAAAAVIGFALVRIVRTGIEDASGTGGKAKGGRGRRSGRNADSTAGGGA